MSDIDNLNHFDDHNKSISSQSKLNKDNEMCDDNININN